MSTLNYNLLAEKYLEILEEDIKVFPKDTKMLNNIYYGSDAQVIHHVDYDVVYDTKFGAFVHYMRHVGVIPKDYEWTTDDYEGFAESLADAMVKAEIIAQKEDLDIYGVSSYTNVRFGIILEDKSVLENKKDLTGVTEEVAEILKTEYASDKEAKSRSDILELLVSQLELSIESELLNTSSNKIVKIYYKGFTKFSHFGKQKFDILYEIDVDTFMKEQENLIDSNDITFMEIYLELKKRLYGKGIIKSSFDIALKKPYIGIGVYMSLLDKVKMFISSIALKLKK